MHWVSIHHALKLYWSKQTDEAKNKTCVLVFWVYQRVTILPTTTPLFLFYRTQLIPFLYLFKPWLCLCHHLYRLFVFTTVSPSFWFILHFIFLIIFFPLFVFIIWFLIFFSECLVISYMLSLPSVSDSFSSSSSLCSFSVSDSFLTSLSFCFFIIYLCARCFFILFFLVFFFSLWFVLGFIFIVLVIFWFFFIFVIIFISCVFTALNVLTNVLKRREC